MKLLKLALIAALSCLMGCSATPEPAQPSQGLSLATSATASAAADVDAGIRDIAAMRLDKSLGAGAGFKQPTVPFPPAVQKMLTVLAPHTIAATPVPPEVATAAAPGT